MDSNAFLAEVKYDANTNKVTLVKGHSWAFNGKSAWRSVKERWKNEKRSSGEDVIIMIFI